MHAQPARTAKGDELKLSNKILDVDYCRVQKSPSSGLPTGRVMIFSMITLIEFDMLPLCSYSLDILSIYLG
jgi:hypothetical protein